MTRNQDGPIAHAKAGAPLRLSASRADRGGGPVEAADKIGTVSFLNTTTVFGTPTEVTLSKLALEMLFPADPATIAIVKAMVEEEAAQAIESGLQKAS